MSAASLLIIGIYSANMSVGGLSLGKIAIILIAAGVVIVFAIPGFQARDIFFCTKHNWRNASDNKRTGNLHSTSWGRCAADYRELSLWCWRHNIYNIQARAAIHIGTSTYQRTTTRITTTFWNSLTSLTSRFSCMQSWSHRANKQPTSSILHYLVFFVSFD